SGPIHDEARKVLAWEDIDDEKDELRLDESQKRQLAENLKKAERDLKESVWRTYKNLVVLGRDNQLRIIDLGLVNSSQAESLVSFILARLRQDGEVEPNPSPNFLVRNWPPAFKEWSTKAVRDAFFASPQFPRLLDPEAVRGTIARGVEAGLLAYVGKTGGSDYEPFIYGHGLGAEEVEISDDLYVITKETAESYKKLKEKPPVLTSLVVSPPHLQIEPGKKQAFLVSGVDQYSHEITTGNIEWRATGGTIANDGVYSAGNDEGNFIVTVVAATVTGSATVTIAQKGAISALPPPRPAPGVLRWSGEVPPQKWMNFYTKVLSKFAAGKGLSLQVSFEVDAEQAISPQKIEETRTALQEIGLNTDVRTD
ncbi:MAG: ATP-binding protein, partial [Terriglobia bacterium]